jgi:hypothetical protein
LSVRHWSAELFLIADEISVDSGSTTGADPIEWVSKSDGTIRSHFAQMLSMGPRDAFLDHLLNLIH